MFSTSVKWIGAGTRARADPLFDDFKEESDFRDENEEEDLDIDSDDDLADKDSVGGSIGIRTWRL